MNRNAIKLLRSIRNAGLVALGPVDYVKRVVSGKTDLPPLHLRRYVGPLSSFESSGVEFMGYVREIAGLQTDERVLDVGCGCGQMALHLKDYLNESGSYVGVDINRPSINWCRKKIARRHKNFDFAHIDVRNLAYNPNGTQHAEAYRFPFADRSFDLILLKSVFTHMRPPDVSNYLGEVSRLMKNNGRCLATFFLLNDAQAFWASDKTGRASKRLAIAGRGLLPMPLLLKNFTVVGATSLPRRRARGKRHHLKPRFARERRS